MKIFNGLLVLSFALLAMTSPSSAQVNITTWQVDLQHTGLNSHETILNAANVSANGSFGLLFTQALDGQTYGQALYASNVNVGGTTHNIVYVGTEHDSLYAFDADNNSGANANPIWHVSMLPAGTVPVPQGEVGSGDISVELGLTTTPVIDTSSSTIYVVSKVKKTSNTTYHQYLHALDLATGAEKFGGPIEINPTFAGKAPDAVSGVIPFSALHEHTRAAMILYNGIVYISYASHSDTQPYHGEIIGYDATTLQLVRTFISTPNGREGGIWGAGAGPAIDSAGNMYVTLGNGGFDQASGSPYTTGTDWGESFVKLSTTGTGPFTANFSDSTTFFTPNNWATLNNGDLDVGSSGVLLLPDQAGPHQHILVGGGKGHVLYVVDRDHPGGINATADPAIQEISEVGSDWLFVTPAYFNGYIYYSPSGGALEQRAVGYNATTQTYIADPPTFSSNDTYAVKGSGCFITANGTADGLIWMLNGSLRVHNATNVSGAPIFSYNMPGTTTKFTIPMVANGKAYATCYSTGTNAGQLCVFGLLTQATTVPAAPSNLVAITASSSQISLTWNDNSSNESGFKIMRSLTTNGTYALVTTVGANTTSYTDGNLSANTTYFYKIFATNNKGDSATATNTASAKTFTLYNPPGLVGYWNFDENTGATATDITGNGHTGSVNGEYDWAGGIINSAINFHGTGFAASNVTVPNSAVFQFTATQSFTLAAWVNPANIHGAEQAIIAKSADQGNAYGIYINASNQWVFRGPQGDIVGPTAIQDTWTHVTAIQDGALGVRTLYVNGVQVATGVAQAANGAGDLWIGQQNLPTTFPDSFPGQIDEVQLYNIPLTANQIPDIMGPPVLQAISSLTQGAGTYGLVLSPSNTKVIESRQGVPAGKYNIVMTFAAPVSGLTGSLTLQNGGTATGSVQSISYDSTNTIVTVVLTGVGNDQALNLHLSGVQPGNGTVDIPFNVLWGDVNGDSGVTNQDANLDQSKVGVAVSATTALYDINSDGAINATDVSLINGQVGTFLGVPTLSNLALFTSATSSSVQGTDVATNAVDGNTGTRWTAADGTFPQWCQVDLGAIDTISRVDINWFSNASRAYKYRINISNTDPTFATSTLVKDNTTNTTFGPTSDSFTPIAARYVRVTVTGSTAGFASAYEFAVFGVPGTGTSPSIANQPTAQVVTSGSQATFSVGLSGSGTVTYQWQKNGNNIAGATGSTFTIPASSSAYGGSYTVVVTNAYGSTTSTPVTLTVNPAAAPDSPTDTPTMPTWGLLLMALLFLGVGYRFLSPKTAGPFAS